MKISLNWLRNYVALEHSVAEIEQALTLIGFEVEEVVETGLAPVPNVVVGEVLERAPHPNADRLSVCRVRTSPEEEPRNIVCGASNYSVGDHVPVALPGAKLAGGLNIKQSKLRGVVSDGMMCSPRELGLGEDHDGLLILTGKPAVGTPIHEALPAADVIFDIEVTPNRPDCLSHIGIAREMAAYFRLELDYPVVRTSTQHPFVATENPCLRAVRSDTPANCPHYRAYCLTGVRVAPSPDWLRERLEAIGLRPINNVVDVTNFVLHEIGQPLHAFDAAKLSGGKIIVRQAHRGETLDMLDGKRRDLHQQMTVIADADRAIALAGIMGGIETEVDETTTDVVLEAAWFNPANIRWAARRVGVATDSSYRFERGVDPEGTEYAALRAVDLIAEIAGGSFCGPALIDGAPPMEDREIDIAPDYVRKRLGFALEDREIREALESLQLEVSEIEDPADPEQATYRVGIPAFRIDLERPIDLVEEVLRMYGTDRIPDAVVRAPGLIAEDSPIVRFQRRVNVSLVEKGFHECMHYSMRSEDEVRGWFSHAAADTLALTNPLAMDQSHLRPSLVPGLLDAMLLNQNRRNTPSGLFETGRVFREQDGRLWELFSIAFTLPAGVGDPQWRNPPDPDYYTVAGIAKQVLELAGVAPELLREPVPVLGVDPWQEGHSAELGDLQEGFLARFGLLNVAMTRGRDIAGMVYGGSIHFLPEFLAEVRPQPRYRPFSLFPDSTRDLALLVDREQPAERVRSELESAAREATGEAFDVESVRIFDVYEGKGLPEGRKSLAFSIRFRSAHRTLKEEEVAAAFQRIQEAITRTNRYAIRS